MSTTSTIEPPTTTGAWFRTLDGRPTRLPRAFGGYALDAYDFQVLPLGLVAIAAYFHLSSGAAGCSARSRWWRPGSVARWPASWPTGSGGFGR